MGVRCRGETSLTLKDVLGGESSMLALDIPEIPTDSRDWQGVKTQRTTPVLQGGGLPM